MAFISLVKWNICIFHSWLRHSWNINIFHFTWWNKSHIQQKHLNILYIRGVIRKFAERCYKIVLFLLIAMKIHKFKLLLFMSWLKLNFRKCDVRRISTRRRCDVTSLDPGHLYPWVVSWVQNSYWCLNWLVIFKESRFPSFFEHNMRFLCYNDVLCIQINMFEIKRQAWNVSIFPTFCEFQIKTYFLVRIWHNNYYFGLNY